MAMIWKTTVGTTVNGSGAPFADSSSVSVLDDGGYVVVWGGSGEFGFDGTAIFSTQDVFARRYNAAGVAITDEFRVDTDGSNARYNVEPSVAALSDGGFVIGWTEERYRASSNPDSVIFEPFFRSYEADGSPGAIIDGRTGSGTSHVSDERLMAPTVVAGWRDGGHVAVEALNFSPGIYITFRNEAGGEAALSYIETLVEADADPLAVAALNSGFTAVAWASEFAVGSGQPGSADGDGSGVFLRLLGPAGQTFVSGAQVNTANVGDQYAPTIGALKSGGFVIAWQSESEIRAQIFSTTGGRVGQEFRVDTEFAPGNADPTVIGLSGGGFVVAWQTFAETGGGGFISETHVQRFTAAGAKVGGEVTVATGSNARVDALANDAFVLTWSEGENVFQRIIQAPTATTTPTLTRAAEIIDGDATAETFLAAPGTLGAGDALHGRGGADTLQLTAPGTLDLTKATDISGIERLVGTSGDDSFVVNERALQGFTSVSLGGGTDAFVVARGFFDLKAGLNVNELRALAPGVDNFVDINGNDFAQRISGDIGRNTLNGRGGNDTLIGGGNDELIGGTGNDTFRVASNGDAVVEFSGGGFDTVLAAATYFLSAEASIEVLKTQNDAGTAGIYLYGNEFAQAITGNAGANQIDGQGGADTMTGLGGSDTYFVDNAGDRVVEANVAGTDIVYSSVSFTLGNFVENLDLSAGFNAPINGTGNALANDIFGTYEANRLDGKGGADRMYGLGGDDIYTVDNVGDRVYEFDGDGTDSVFSSVTFTLAGQFAENLTLTGSAAVNATGNGLANILTGNAAANVVNGGAGADAMRGGGGNDTYVVDDAGDVVTEARDAGADRVLSSVGLTLSNHVENLTLTGTGDIAGAGNDLANTIVGNAGRNALDGRTGADVMAGGAGNDSYVVDNARDRVIETNATGYDTVYSSVSFSLAGGFAERLILTGPAVSATGNALDNNLQGTAAANVLIGGAGADAMLGGAGDDVYYVDDAGDQAIENAGEGIDTVNSTVSFSLFASSVENVVLSGAAAIDATGNDAVNKLVGGTGRNVLNGGLGADVLTGNAGFDTFFFNSALGPADIDRITDFVVADDVIRLENAVFVGLATGVLAADAFVVGAAAQDAEDRIIYDRASGRLLYDADGDGAGAAQQFAFIAKGLAMTRADFVVV